MCYDVRDEDFAHVADNFQPPSDDEEAIRYHPALPFEGWARQYFG